MNIQSTVFDNTRFRFFIVEDNTVYRGELTSLIYSRSVIAIYPLISSCSIEYSRLAKANSGTRCV